LGKTSEVSGNADLGTLLHFYSDWPGISAQNLGGLNAHVFMRLRRTRSRAALETQLLTISLVPPYL
jgi:hypothetical protein